MARRIPENWATPHSLSADQEAPFSSELPPQRLAAHTDLLWTSPEEVSGINKQEVTGKFSTRDSSTIQQFEALHLRAERGGLRGRIVFVRACTGAFMVDELSTPCLILVNLYMADCKISE